MCYLRISSAVNPIQACNGEAPQIATASLQGEATP